MNIRLRLLEFKSHLGMGDREFARETGLSNSYVKNLNSMGSEKIELVAKRFPELNIEWLILGKGEMLKKEPEPIPIDEDLLRMTRILLEKEKENEILKIKIKELEKASVFYKQRDDDVFKVSEKGLELKTEI